MHRIKQAAVDLGTILFILFIHVKTSWVVFSTIL
jgi:hypothetical protein